jgi:hypothetical protein
MKTLGSSIHKPGSKYSPATVIYNRSLFKTSATDLFFMVSSIQVACLLAYCVLIGSLAELLFSFCVWNVLAFLQMVDAISGKVISPMVIVLAFKVHCNT